jgi:SAM-dependent methyltransferase
MLRATELAHDVIRRHVRPGDAVVDATAGNGKDTLFLARLVGTGGCVHAFDIQATALQNTRTHITAEAPESAARVVLHHAGHENMAEFLPSHLHGRLAAVIFNLGYLPGGDKTVITNSASTLPALTAAASLLRTGGILTVVVYAGHAGAENEACAVEAWFTALPADWSVWRCHNMKASLHSPYLLTATKL